MTRKARTAGSLSVTAGIVITREIIVRPEPDVIAFGVTWLMRSTTGETCKIARFHVVMRPFELRLSSRVVFGPGTCPGSGK